MGAASIAIGLIIGAGSLAADECVNVDGDAIRAADLASAVPAFRGLDPDLRIGYTPAPGIQRSFPASRLKGILRRNGVAEPQASAVCVERSAEELSEARVTAALRTALREPEAALEIVELSQQRVPRGTLRFERKGLQSSPRATRETPLLWRGTVEYGERRSVSIWARVRIGIRQTQIVALRDLPSGDPIRLEDIDLRTIEAPPTLDKGFSDLEDVAGAVPRRRIPAGSVIFQPAVSLPNDVERGDMVRVLVAIGAARVEFEAKAASAGRSGDRIQVLNPTTGKRFAAVIEGRGRVGVRRGAGLGGS